MGYGKEVLAGYREHGQEFDSLCLLQPTSPLQTAEDIKAAYALFQEKAKFTVVSVCEAEHSPLWCRHLLSNQEFVGFVKQDNIKQRQTRGKFYRLNGAIYYYESEIEYGY